MGLNLTIYLVGPATVILGLLFLARVVKPKHVYVDFPHPPGLARINTPRKGWDENRRKVTLPNGDPYVIPEGSTGHFVLLFKWSVNCTRGDKKYRYQIPNGTTTDFASIPKILHSLINPLSNSIYAAILHDYIYRNPSDKVAADTSKEEADQIFYWGLRACGVSRITAGLMYIGVMIGGKSSYTR